MRASVASISSKLLSTFFAATLAFGLVPVAAFADEGIPVDADRAQATPEGTVLDGADLSGDDVDGSIFEADASIEDEVAGDAENPETTIPAGGVVNQEMPLDTLVAQAESTQTYFLAHTLESTRTVSMVSAKLPLGGEGTEEVVGSFVLDGMTFAIEPDGASVALVAVDYGKLSEECVSKQVVVIPETASPDGIDSYSVTRIADDAFAGLTKDNADPDYVGARELFSDEELLAEVGIDPADVAEFLADGGAAVAAQVSRDADASSIQAQAEACAYEDGSDPETFSDDIRTIVSVDGNIAALDDGSTYEFGNPLAGCMGILALGIPASVTQIEDDAFKGFDTLQYLVVSDENPNYSPYDGCLYDKPQTSLLLIPEGRVGAVRIAPSATDVDPEVFSHCPSVDALVADADSAAFTSVDGCLYRKDLLTFLCAPCGLTKVSIAGACQQVAPRALEDCSEDMEVIKLGDAFSAHSISERMFSDEGIPLLGGSSAEGEEISEDLASKQLYAASSGNLTFASNVPTTFRKRFYTVSGGFQSESTVNSSHTIPAVGRYVCNEGYIQAFNANGNWDDMFPNSPAGYTFEGIYLDAGFTQKVPYKVSTNVTGSTTVYHRFVANRYTIAYANMTGCTLPGQQTEYTIESPDFALAIPNKIGYTFAGWNVTGASGAGVTGNGTTNVTVKKGTYGNLTATAKWTPNAYAVSFDPNGGSGGQSANVTATYDAAMPAISATAPVRTGYSFEGWYDTSAASGGMRYYTAEGASASTWNKTAAATLYARWSANPYTAYLHANDGTDTVIEHAVTYDATVASASVPKRYGYVFSGYWTKEADGTKGEMYFDEDGAYVKGDVWRDATDMDLYACWTLMANLEMPINAPGTVTLGVDRATAIGEDASGTQVGPNVAGTLRSAVPQEVPLASVELEPLQDDDGTSSASRILGEGNPERCAVEVSLGSSASALLRLADPSGTSLRWEPSSPLLIPAAVPVAADATGDDLTTDALGNLARTGELSLSYAMKLLPGFDVYEMPTEDVTSEPVARIVFTVDLTGLVQEEF